MGNPFGYDAALKIGVSLPLDLSFSVSGPEVAKVEIVDIVVELSVQNVSNTISCVEWD